MGLWYQELWHLVALITFLCQMWRLFKGGTNLSKYSHAFNLVRLKARKPKQRFWVTPFKNLFFTLATLPFSFKESHMSMEKISGSNTPRLLHLSRILHLWPVGLPLKESSANLWCLESHFENDTLHGCIKILNELYNKYSWTSPQWPPLGTVESGCCREV